MNCPFPDASTAGGNGVDYLLSGTSVTLDKGVTESSVSLSVVDDNMDETNETIVISASSTPSVQSSENLVITIVPTTMLPELLFTRRKITMMEVRLVSTP